MKMNGFNMLKTRKKIYVLAFVLAICFLDIAPVFALSIMVHVPEKYTDVEAGERFYFELEIKYPENPRRKDLRLNYEIKKDDEIIAQAKHLKAIETQASFMDYIVIPENTESGLYIINIVINDYEDLKEEVSASFYVVGEKGAQLKLYFFILLGVVILVGGLVVVNIVTNKQRANRGSG